ncbi:MAG: hypothetical protein KBG48_32980 [Kofleriaceae bacterium]|jgi:hypothetical protein|nr:hypothetical protein [Kofleriaceae bacterium]MBP9172224.1 hypothetical protein [Kofleriaceae bacterium]MBP9863650.1 hypothetical protein [Kofleriaceae bacterium]
MSLIVCSFAGWVQVRLATNADPPDETRGLSGYTFALPGEPDLDRVLRTSAPVAPRTHGPAIGLAVHAVSIDGVAVPSHPLIGARVDFLSAPLFESVNDVVMDQGIEALEPFDLALTQGEFRFRRRDYLDPGHPEATVYTVPPALLAKRRTAGFSYGTQLMQEALGMTDATAFRAARLATLRSDLEITKDPVARAGLTRRISELELDDPQDHRTTSMYFIETRTYQLNGPIELVDPARWLAGLDTYLDNQISLVMGAWDADAMSAYAAGTVAFSTH